MNVGNVNRAALEREQMAIDKDKLDAYTSIEGRKLDTDILTNEADNNTALMLGSGRSPSRGVSMDSFDYGQREQDSFGVGYGLTGYATGGEIQGSGQDGVDNIPIAVQNGEYILPVATVEFLGREWLDKIVMMTNGEVPNNAEGNVIEGEVEPAALPGYASGGGVPWMSGKDQKPLVRDAEARRQRGAGEDYGGGNISNKPKPPAKAAKPGGVATMKITDPAQQKEYGRAIMSNAGSGYRSSVSGQQGVNGAQINTSPDANWRGVANAMGNATAEGRAALQDRLRMNENAAVARYLSQGNSADTLPSWARDRLGMRRQGENYADMERRKWSGALRQAMMGRINSPQQSGSAPMVRAIKQYSPNGEVIGESLLMFNPAKGKFEYAGGVQPRAGSAINDPARG
jgi:hypothetical protein